MKKFLMYGAGNIGRGFIGRVFGTAGYGLCFVDVNEEIVARLNADKRYPVELVSENVRAEITVKNVRAVNGRDEARVAEEIAGCDLMATAVGVNALKYIARLLAAGLNLRMERGRPPLDIIICENMLGADTYLRGLVAENMDEQYRARLIHEVGFVEASIGCMVPAVTEADKDGNPLRVFAEPYDFLPVDKAAFRGPLPDVSNLRPYAPFALMIQRKLFMHNMSHAVTAYLGAAAGYEYIYQAVGDPRIRAAARAALDESVRALADEHGADPRELAGHADDLIRRFGNAALKDTVARVGWDTIRKLGADDRLTGAFKLCVKHGVYPRNIMEGVAAALRFGPPGDVASAEVSAYANAYGPVAALQKYAGLGAEYGEYLKEIERIFVRF
ncbi:MAG: mannitol dehydrogenase [Firmicutes bacterium]|nr:mannitol dehydrogenase [Bacillota bacterium]